MRFDCILGRNKRNVIETDHVNLTVSVPRTKQCNSTKRNSWDTDKDYVNMAYSE